MKISCSQLCIISMFAITAAGCQPSSDYLIGDYDVVTTIKTSTCQAFILELPSDFILPTNLLPGQTTHHSWKIERIGITGTGSNHITLEMRVTDRADDRLKLSGMMDHGFVHIEAHQPLHHAHCEMDRFVFLSGFTDSNRLSGDIRTILTNVRGSDECRFFIPPTSSCEVHEEFIGIVRDKN